MDFIYPVSLYLKITQVYHETHLGLDFGWHDMKPEYINQPIVASEAGDVVAAVDGYDNTYPNNRIYGNYVIIYHGEGYYTVYGHLLKGSVCVSKGKRIAKGAMIGRMGNTGYSNGTHLHYELRKGGNDKKYSINPITYLYVEDRSIYVNPESKWYDRIQYKDLVYPVDRDATVNQLEVTISDLNLRNGPGLSYERFGFVPRGIYNVTSKKTADGYTWYKIGDAYWCAGVNGVNYLKRSKAKLYTVTFPSVTSGDKVALVSLGKELGIEYKIEEVK